MTIIRKIQLITRKILIMVFTLFSVIAVGAVAAATQGFPCSDITLEEVEQPHKGYGYTLTRSECANTLRVRVHTNFAEPHVFETYKTHSHSLEPLTAQHHGRELPVMITFAQPLNDTDLAAFVSQTGVQVHSLIIGLRDAQGAKAALTYWLDDGQILSTQQFIEKGLLDPTTQRIQGVLVISGNITMTETTMRAIATHQQVALFDLTALDILPTLERKYQTTITDIFLPSPYWNGQW